MIYLTHSWGSLQAPFEYGISSCIRCQLPGSWRMDKIFIIVFQVISSQRVGKRQPSNVCPTRITIVYLWRTSLFHNSLKYRYGEPYMTSCSKIIFKIIIEMKYFHRNYFFLLTASALTTGTVAVSYTHLSLFFSLFLSPFSSLTSHNVCLSICLPLSLSFSLSPPHIIYSLITPMQ